MTGIEWTDETWNPVTGCRKVSPGCAHCYAATWAARQMGPWRGRAFEDVRTHADRLDAPLHWRKPRRVFVNSMSDLFHDDVPGPFIEQVFAIMACAPRHTFQVLTKRPRRMLEWFTTGARASMVAGAAQEMGLRKLLPDCAMRNFWPLPNVWLGVSAEDQQRADERVPLLLRTPAAVRFVSAEPLIECVEFGLLPAILVDGKPAGAGIDWIIVGGESGPGARPCAVEWIREAVRYGKSAGVPVFVKQLGTRPACYLDERECPGELIPVRRLLDRKGGDPAEWPDDLRVREFPR